MLSAIHGRSGDKNGSKIMKSLFDTIIEPESQRLFTWTGKSSTNCTKVAFRDYKAVINLLYAVARLADSGYTLSRCEHDLTYRVLKHAKKNGYVNVLNCSIKYY